MFNVRGLYILAWSLLKLPLENVHFRLHSPLGDKNTTNSKSNVITANEREEGM